MIRYSGVLLAALFMILGCTEEQEVQKENEPLRFAVMTFAHETCTFCPGGDTDIEDWVEIRPPLVGDEVFSGG
ncbi:MAG: hypothetical protein O7F72_08915, partial [Proteobacteria bacterium]|nr:hypothetical protein [Pseudomonadota bacterium]